MKGGNVTRLLFHPCVSPSAACSKAPLVLQSLSWKGQCCTSNGVVRCCPTTRGVRYWCPFGGAKQQRQEAFASQLSQQPLAVPCCRGAVLASGISLPIPCSSRKGDVPGRACPPSTWTWCVSLPSRGLLGKTPPALATLEGNGGGRGVSPRVAGPWERWAEPHPQLG